MKLKKILAAFCAAALLTTGCATTALAAEPTDFAPISATYAAVKPGTGIEPQADLSETYFRVNAEGQPQYRRWNATRGYWIDPDWIDLGTP